MRLLPSSQWRFRADPGPGVPFPCNPHAQPGAPEDETPAQLAAFAKDGVLQAAGEVPPCAPFGMG